LLQRLPHPRRLPSRQPQATSRPQANAMRSTRRTKPRSGPQVRQSASSSPHVARAVKPSRKGLQPRRPRLLLLRRPAPCSPGNNRPHLPQRPRHQATALRLRRELANSPPRRKLNPAAPERQSFGSTRTRTSITSPEPATTATRSGARICARPTLRQPVVGRRRTSGILRGDTGSSGERHKRADSRPTGCASGRTGV
jgi:hypothetical protein